MTTTEVFVFQVQLHVRTHEINESQNGSKQIKMMKKKDIPLILYVILFVMPSDYLFISGLLIFVTALLKIQRKKE